MIKTLDEAIEAYKKKYIELASELKWYENRPLGGLREANSDGRMRAMTALYDYKRSIQSTLQMSEEEMKKIDLECGPAMHAMFEEKTIRYEEARKAYHARPAP